MHIIVIIIIITTIAAIVTISHAQLKSGIGNAFKDLGQVLM
jgi:hypothetical protein